MTPGGPTGSSGQGGSGDWHRWSLLLVVAFIATTSQLFRNSHVVVAPNIMQDLGVSAAALGGLSGALFIAAAFTQIPAGVLIDRYGPRRTIPVMLLLAAAGAGGGVRRSLADPLLAGAAG